MTNSAKWEAALTEIQTIIENTYGLKEGRYEILKSDLPLYSQLRGDYNSAYPYASVVVHGGKWTTDKVTSNNVLTVGHWPSFDEEACAHAWMRWKQLLEAKRTNSKIEEADTLLQKVGVAIRHNQTGFREGWLEEQYSKGCAPKGSIEMSSLTEGRKVKKSTHCPFSWEISINPGKLDQGDIPDIKSLISQKDLFWRDYTRLGLLNSLNFLTNPGIDVWDIASDKYDKYLIQPVKLMDENGYNVLPIEEGVRILERGGILISRSTGFHWELGWSTTWKELYAMYPGTGKVVVNPRNWVLPESSYVVPESDKGRAYTKAYKIPQEGAELYQYRWQLWAKYGIDFYQFLEDRSYNTTANGVVERTAIVGQCEDCPVEIYNTGGGGNAWVAMTQFTRFRIK